VRHSVLLLGILVTSVAARSDVLPAPPWAAQQRGPTSAYEITAYLAGTLPYLDNDLCERIADMLDRGESPARALALVQAARWQARIASATVPWELTAQNSGDADAQLRQNLSALGNQLDTLAAPNATSLPPLSVSATLSAMRLLDELKQRVANTNDPLRDLGLYVTLLRLRGAPLTIFWWARNMISLQNNRAYHLLEFLSSAMNPDGFSRGNAIYFLGHLQYFVLHNPMAAFTNLLRVQQFPACLVFTAHSYLHAASVLTDMNMPVHALALLAVDVPCIDFYQLAYTRHVRSAWLRSRLHDYTNAVRHLQTAARMQPHNADAIAGHLAAVPCGTSIWAAVATCSWSSIDVQATIEWAVTNRCDTPDDRIFLDALMHDWPAQEAMPPAIATNRVLNNNIFPRVSRRLRVAPFTPVGDQ